MENSVKEAEQKIPQIDCNDITREKAYVDLFNFLEPTLVPNGDYHCFCKNTLEKEGFLAMNRVKLGDDGSCKPWFKLQNSMLYVTMGMPVLVAIINLGTELLITVGSDFTRPICQ